MNAAANLSLVVAHQPRQSNQPINNSLANTSANQTISSGISTANTTTTTPNQINTTNNTTNCSSLSDSLASTTDGHRTPNIEHLSRTNLYIRGLQQNTSDQDLYNMCARFGQISSTKAIIDKSTGFCRGYGFVEFNSPRAAEIAVKELTKSGIQAQMAKISSLFSSHHHHHHNHNHYHHNHHAHHSSNAGGSNNNSGNQHNNNGSSAGGSNTNNGNINNNHHHQHSHNSPNNNNADPTNLYIANLPPNMSEQELENLLSTYGNVVSTRILRDQSNIPRGVGFARMESRDKCEQIIEQLNGRPYKGWKDPLLVKFADGGNKKRHHHNNQHQHQHHSNNPHQHHKVHQDDNRWRDGVNAVDINSVSSFDHQGNISHSNHIPDLAMMSNLSYPRIQPGFPTVAAGAAYPASLGPPTSAPQWIHPSGPGQPYVIPQQMLQAGLGPSNQAAAAAAAAALHYGHIPHLTSQMQGLQIAHPGAPVGAYLQPQQWSALWTHPIPHQPQPQPSMRLSAPMQPLLPSQQQQQSPSPMQQQQPPSNPHQQSIAADNKLQLSMPL